MMIGRFNRSADDAVLYREGIQLHLILRLAADLISDTFAAGAERDQYCDSIVCRQAIVFERKTNERLRPYPESIRPLEDRRMRAIAGNHEAAESDQVIVNKA